MDLGVAWRAGLVQGFAVAAVAVALALALPRSFFESWGWLAGPAAWLACAAVTARVVRLPTATTLTGAVLAGLPSLLGVAVGVHWLGAVLGVLLLALWCGRLAVDRELPAEIV